MLSWCQWLFKSNIYLDIWSQWSSWSLPCSHSCGGYKSRTRYCIKGDCTVNNPGCPGESSQTVDCDHANQGRHYRIYQAFTEVTCRYSDHGLQPGRDLHTFHQGDILTPLHPRQSPSVAHSHRDRSLWRSLWWNLFNLPAAQIQRSWLDALLHWIGWIKDGSLCLAISQWRCSDGRLLQRWLHGAGQQLQLQSVHAAWFCQVGILEENISIRNHLSSLVMPVPSMTGQRSF